MDKNVVLLSITAVLLGTSGLIFSEPTAHELWYDKELEKKAQKEGIVGTEKKSDGLTLSEKDLDERRKAEIRRVREERKTRAKKKREAQSLDRQERHQHTRKIRHEEKKQVKQSNKERRMEREAHGDDRKERVRSQRHQQQALMEAWAARRCEEVDRDYAAGRYADLFKLPTWPVWQHFFHNDNYFHVATYYQHADDAYDSSGHNRDVSILGFGEQPVRVKDILLVSQLQQPSSKKLDSVDLIGTGVQSACSKYLEFLGDKEITFQSTVEAYGVDLNVAHHLYSRDVAIGVHLPIVYKKHRMTPAVDIFDSETMGKLTCMAKENVFNAPTSQQGAGVAGVGSVQNHPSVGAFAKRYGNNPRLFIDDIVRSKCFDRIGGSETGLGDMSIYLTGNINSSWWDRGTFGIRMKLPTSKQESPWKLWGPALGTGTTDVAAHCAFMTSYDRHFNPHVSLEGLVGLSGHVDKRVPQLVTITDEQAEANRNANQRLHQLVPDLTFANRVTTLAANGGFSEYDTCRRGWADHVHRVRMATGFQTTFIFGNIVERFISRRGFLDLYYRLTLKWRDRVLCATDDRDLDPVVWNINLLKEESTRLAHDLGWEYTYQFDHDSRAQLGMRYTVAGQNTAKLFEVHALFSHSF